MNENIREAFQGPSRAYSFRSQMMLSFALLALGLTAVIWIFQQFFLAQGYLNAQQNLLIRTVKTIEQTILNEPSVNRQDYLDALSTDSGISLEWYSASGQLLAASGTTVTETANGHMGMGRGNLVGPRVMGSSYGDAVAREGAVLAQGPFSRFNTELIVYVYRDSLGDLLVASSPIAAIDAAVAILEKQLIWLAAGMLIFALVLGALLATTMTRTLAQVEGSVKNIAKGDFSVRIRPKGAKEWVSLANSINQMTVDLGRTDQLKDDLIANVSHELRTPLGIIQGYAEMLIDMDDFSPQERQMRLRHISEEARRLGTMVHTLLDVSQVRAGTLPLDLSPVNLMDLAKEVCEFYRALAQQKGITVGISPDLANEKETFTVEADAMRLRQMLGNLMDNALKFTPGGGTITLIVEAGAIAVKDTGVGIKPEDQERVFDRHFRVSQGLSGAGLGLSMVKDLADAMGISVALTSQVGLGTRIQLNFLKKL